MGCLPHTWSAGSKHLQESGHWGRLCGQGLQGVPDFQGHQLLCLTRTRAREVKYATPGFCNQETKTATVPLHFLREHHILSFHSKEWTLRQPPSALEGE